MIDKFGDWMDDKIDRWGGFGFFLAMYLPILAGAILIFAVIIPATVGYVESPDEKIERLEQQVAELQEGK